MKLVPCMALGAAAAALSLPALADDQTILVNSNGTTYFNAVGTVLSDGSDVLTFEFASAGTYAYVLTYTGLYIDNAGATVSTSGATVTTADYGAVNYGSVSGTVTVAAGGSFTLTLTGTTSNATAGYSGLLSTTSTATTAAVPEPETYAMMLAGLLCMGFVSHRRRSPH